MKNIGKRIKNIIVPPQAQILQIISGFYTSFTIKAAIDLDIFQTIQTNTMNSKELSECLKTNHRNTIKLMKALIYCGLVSENRNGQYRLTKTGKALLPGRYPKSIAPLGKYILDNSQIQPLMELAYSIQTNKPSFQKITGMEFYEYGKANPEFLETMDSAMEIYAGMSLPETIRAYPFSKYKIIVDIAGGLGHNLYGILGAHKNTDGILFDQPATIVRAKKHYSTTGLNGRCKFIAGNMFEEIPKGGDLYVLSKTLNDWDDEHALKILRSVRKAMNRHCRLIIIEMIEKKGNVSIQQLYRDFALLSMCGGYVRNLDAFEQLFVKSGLKLKRVIPIKGPFAIAGFIKMLGAFSILEVVPQN